MKATHYSKIAPKHFDGGQAKAVAGRVAIGKADGADNFCMRVFEIGAGGHTPLHRHPWEHEMFYHSGRGEVLVDGKPNPVEPGSVVFVPPGAEHQVRNTGAEPLVLVCLVPPAAPEM
jgi:quercetin dioxygenase-like cupin family protein